MRTAIIILNYNSYEDTINSIESIERYNTAPIKYIVVDNGSKRKNTVINLDEYFQKRFCKRYIRLNEIKTCPNTLPYLTFIVSPTNDGYASGNNKGLTLAYKDNEVDKILILNNDILFVEDIIPGLVMAMERLPDCAAISPILYKKNLVDIDYNCARKNVQIGELVKENFLHYWYRLLSKGKVKRNRNNYILPQLAKPYPRILPIELPSGACMLIYKRTFQEIGSFDPNTFLYFEENILYKKVSEVGLKNYLCTEFKCVHLGASSTSSVSSLFLVNCDIDSSRYYAKNYSGCSFFAFLLFYISTLFYRMSFILQKTISGKPI